MVCSGIALSAVAKEPLICVFTQECVGEGDCGAVEPIAMGFQLQGDAWVMQGAEDTAIRFSELADKTAGMHSYLAENADPDAAAVSILSVFEDGQAFMSTHGIFLTPGFVTHIGTCVQKEN